MKRNVFLEIHGNGHILLSERLSLKLKCPMHLRYYPFDLQICPIRIESYAFRDTQVIPESGFFHHTSTTPVLHHLKLFQDENAMAQRNPNTN